MSRASGDLAEYWQARNEHALLLRNENMTLREIAIRLGISENNAYYKIARMRKNGKDKGHEYG